MSTELFLSDKKVNTEFLDLSGEEIKNIPYIIFPDVKYLNLTECVDLIDISNILLFEKLEVLEISGCSSIKNLSILNQLPNLKTLIMYDCNLDIPQLNGCKIYY